MNLLADIGGSSMKLAISTNEGLLTTCKVSLEHSLSITQVLNKLLKEAQNLVIDCGLEWTLVTHIGLAFPGIIDDTNTVLSINDKHFGITEFNFQDWALQNGFETIRLENDARAALMGEYHHQLKRSPISHMVGITLGTGIGCSVIRDGQIWYGSRFQAGINMGHSIISINQKKCNCGGIGCAESFASTWALQNDTHYTGFNELFKDVRAGNTKAITILQSVIDAWAACMVNILYAYDPELIILGGAVAHEADYILPRLKDSIQLFIWDGFELPIIKASTLFEKAALLGLHHLINK